MTGCSTSYPGTGATDYRPPPPDSLPPSGGCLSLVELSLFRTDLCHQKATTCFCPLRENCPNSHCLSWHRRNPFVYPYRSILCPNTKFWTEAKRMKVKTWCRRGRSCLFAHTKEEQMYHPMVYKTQVCRDWPGCVKPYCPFAHGLQELRDPDCFEMSVLEGPEIVETSVQPYLIEDRIKSEFDRAQKEREASEVYSRQIKDQLSRALHAWSTPTIVIVDEEASPSNDSLQMLVGVLSVDNIEVLPGGLVAFDLTRIAADIPLTEVVPAEEDSGTSGCSSAQLELEIASPARKMVDEVPSGVPTTILTPMSMAGDDGSSPSAGMYSMYAPRGDRNPADSFYRERFLHSEAFSAGGPRTVPPHISRWRYGVGSPSSELPSEHIYAALEGGTGMPLPPHLAPHGGLPVAPPLPFLPDVSYQGYLWGRDENPVVVEHQPQSAYDQLYDHPILDISFLTTNHPDEPPQVTSPTRASASLFGN